MSQTPERRREWYARNRERLREQDRQRRYTYGRDCLTCGARTDGSNGRAKAPLYCANCVHDAHRMWTREAIIEAIHLYAHRYNRAPSATDWNPSMARNIGRPDWAERFHTDGDYPSSNTVILVFGSWNAGISAAGYEPRGVGKRGPARAS